MSDFKTLLAIGDLMNKHIVFISKDESIQEGAIKMNSENIGSLLVMDGETTLTGIVTDQDIVRRAVASKLDLEKTPVSEIMSKDPVEIDHTESIFEARNIISDKKVNHLIVTKDKKPIGILTSSNLLGG